MAENGLLSGNKNKFISKTRKFYIKHYESKISDVINSDKL